MVKERIVCIMANYVENNAQTEEIVSYYRAVTAEGFEVIIPIRQGQTVSEALRDYFNY